MSELLVSLIFHDDQIIYWAWWCSPRYLERINQRRQSITVLRVVHRFLSTSRRIISTVVAKLDGECCPEAVSIAVGGHQLRWLQSEDYSLVIPTLAAPLDYWYRPILRRIRNFRGASR